MLFREEDLVDSWLCQGFVAMACFICLLIRYQIRISGSEYYQVLDLEVKQNIYKD